MKPASLYGHLAEVYGMASAGARPADLVIRDYFRARRYLGSKERRFIAERFFGMVRHNILIDVLLREAFKVAGKIQPARPLPTCVLAAAHAILLVHEPVGSTIEAVAEACRTAIPDCDVESILLALTGTGLPPAVLRNPSERIATQHSIPDAVVREWLERWGEEETERLAEVLNHQAPLSLRVNTLRCTVEECRKALAAADVGSHPAVLAPSALVLDHRVTLDALNPYREGWFEMQDEGSQLLSMLLQPGPGMTVVDACAGGGGKTLHCAALMQNSGTLVAIDTDERKLDNLAHRVQRAGALIVRSLLAPRDEIQIRNLAERADAVLVDAPCSGIGTLRRNPGLKLRFHDGLSGELAAVQQKLLEEYSGLVRPGGRLVYSTCTLLRAENEAIAEHFLRTHPEFRLLNAQDILAQSGIRIDASSPYLLLLPHRTTTDGFFAAVFQRGSVAPDIQFS